MKKPNKIKNRGSAPERAASQQRQDALLIQAAINGDVAGIKNALGQGASATATDEGGFTALMWAARYDLPQAAQELMGVSDLGQKDKQGRTAMDIAHDGAGPDSRAAMALQAYRLAQSELAELSSEAANALKSNPRKYRL
jgi:hypothetical protein